MLRIIPLGLVSVLFCSFALTTRGQEREVAPPPKRVLNQDEYVPHSFMGRVMAVTDDTVTIKPEGRLQITESRMENGRSVLVSLYRQDSTKPPKTFVSGDRVRGLPRVRWEGEHKISDLRPGDHVEIECFRTEHGIDCFTYIRIVRRYGGQVPPAIGDHKLPVKDRVATWRNAVQQREEKAAQILSRVFLRFAR